MELQRMQRGRGFTLLEMVVVLVVIGILAAVAAPRMFSTFKKANHVAARSNLSVVRAAIEQYKLRHGDFPGKDGTEATFKTDLRSVMRGAFPKCSVGALNDAVRISTTTGGQAISGEATPAKGWHYHNKKGSFIINWTGLSEDGQPYDQY